MWRFRVREQLPLPSLPTGKSAIRQFKKLRYEDSAGFLTHRAGIDQFLFCGFKRFVILF
jgi:hypothetical protein